MAARAGVESSEKKMRVVMVEVVEEDDKGRRSLSVLMAGRPKHL